MKCKVAKLSDIAIIAPGFSVKGAVAHDPCGTYQVIMGRHLEPGEPYRYEPEHELRINLDRAPDKYLLEPDDILFISRGGTNLPVVLKEFPQPAIAPSTFYVVRPKVEIATPDYVAWAMCQGPFQSQLKEARTGSSTLMISRSALAELSIPVPPIETQQKIVRIGELMLRERSIRQELLEETARLQAAIGRQITLSLIERGNI